MSDIDSPAGTAGGPVPVPTVDDLPEKMRVHALARLLGRTSREVISALAELGVEVRTAQSSIDRKAAEQVVTALLAPPAGAVGEPPAARPPSRLRTRRRTLTEPARRPRSRASALTPLFAPPTPLFQPPAPPAAAGPRSAPPGGRGRGPRAGRGGRAGGGDRRPGRRRGRRRRRRREPAPAAPRSARPGPRPRWRGRRPVRTATRPVDRRPPTSDRDGADDESDEAEEESDADESEPTTPRTAAAPTTRPGPAGAGAGGAAGATARTADGAEDSDPPNTVVRVRQPRERDTGDSGDGVQSVRGSTRLEAKRQRRRDGRDAGRRRVPILSEAEFLARRESVDRTMVVRERGDRIEIGVLEDDILVEHFVAGGGRDGGTGKSLVGNIYLGRVQNVLPSMEAAFVDIGRGRNAVLYAGEVDWDAAGLGGKARRIEQALNSGDSVLVQVTKDPIGHKGARLTTQISLAGRFLVYVPSGGAAGISRKLPDVERKRLKDMLKEIVPSEAGVIIRTASEGVSQEALERDVRRLQAQWEVVKTKSEQTGPSKPKAPVLLYEEPDLLIKVVRDQFNEDFSRLVVEGDEAWDTLQNYVGPRRPRAGRRGCTGTSGRSDVFAAYRIDEQLLKALDRKVWLPSGGTLVIDRTEAMTVIDVNTGQVHRLRRQPRGDRHPEQPGGGRGGRAPAAAARHRRDHRHRLHRHGAGGQPGPGAAPAHRVPGPRPHPAPGGRGHLARAGADDPQAGRRRAAGALLHPVRALPGPGRDRERGAARSSPSPGRSADRAAAGPSGSPDGGSRGRGRRDSGQRRRHRARGPARVGPAQRLDPQRLPGGRGHPHRAGHGRRGRRRARSTVAGGPPAETRVPVDRPAAGLDVGAPLEAAAGGHRAPRPSVAGRPGRGRAGSWPVGADVAADAVEEIVVERSLAEPPARPARRASPSVAPIAEPSDAEPVDAQPATGAQRPSARPGAPRPGHPHRRRPRPDQRGRPGGRGRHGPEPGRDRPDAGPSRRRGRGAARRPAAAGAEPRPPGRGAAGGPRPGRPDRRPRERATDGPGAPSAGGRRPGLTLRDPLPYPGIPAPHPAKVRPAPGTPGATSPELQEQCVDVRDRQDRR